MAYLMRQKYTVHVDARTGAAVPKNTPGAVPTTRESRKWYACGVPGLGRRVPLSADRRRAERMLGKLVEDAELGRVGIAPRADAGRSLDELLVEYEATALAGAGPKHRAAVVGDVRKVLAACRLDSLADLRAPGLAGRVEQFVRGLTTGADPLAGASAAYVGKHARQFTRWLVLKKELLHRDPLAGMALPSQETTTRRRALAADELARLIEAAEASPKPFRTLAGPDRAVLYLVGVATGYRSGELARLTPAHFDLDAEVPIARLPGKATKNRKAAEQPIPPAVVARLRRYLAGRPADRRVWPGSWPDRAAEMLRADLAAAGLPDVVNDEEAVFHSLRHSYTTLLGAVATVKTVQELARHSTPVLTLARYTHSGMAERAEAVGRLPLPGSDVAAGPFAHLSRADLERTAEALLAAALATFLTPPLTQDVEAAGDSVGRAGTRKGRRPAA